MEKFQKIVTATLISLLHLVIGLFSANAQSTTGVYSVTVNTPGTFGQVMLQTVDNWSDVVELAISGHLNDADMAYFSRMQNMTKLDLSQVDISEVSGCEGLSVLQTVVLPESATKIADNAFSGCSSLSTINLDQVTEIGSSSFYRCYNLTDTLTLPNLTTVGASAFFYCDGLIKVAFPNVRILGEEAFGYCSKLLSVSIPNCTDLGSSSFSDCSSLTSVTLSDELEVIPTSTFYRCVLKAIILPSALKTIGERAFYESKLSAIDIPEGVKTIKSEAFNGSPLKSITLPSTLESIEYKAFSYYNYSGGEYSYVLKDVYCKSVVPIVTSTFNNDMAKGATLHVPAMSVSAYKLDGNWYMFNKIEALEGDLADVTINNTFSIIDYTGLADNANLTLTASDSQKTAGHLTVSGNGLLSFNNFIQNQNFKYEYDYYDENYSYPYCTTLITNDEVRANNVTTTILLPTNKWSFISLPYDVDVSSIVVPDSTMWVVRKYNGSNRAAMSGETWENVTSGQTLNAGEGYIFHCISENSDDYVKFEFPAINNSNKNNVFSFNDVVKTINKYPAEFSHNRGWNLIGNPYPSYLSSQYVDFSAPITVWNGDGYTAYSLADDEYVLHPNEAFFVQCPVNSNQIKFLKDGRMHNYTVSSIVNYTRVKAKVSNGRSILNFILADDKYSDRTRLVLNKNASYEYEIEKDASKFMSNNEDVPQIYIIDNGVNYAIDERPLGTGEYSLGVRIGKEGTYKISLNTSDLDYDILLIDKETNETTDLAEKSYTFESDSQIANNRFVVKVMARGGTTSIDDVPDSDAGFTVNGHQLSVNQSTPVSIYSIDGKLIYNGVIDGSFELPAGIYMLSIDNTTHKIAIK